MSAPPPSAAAGATAEAQAAAFANDPRVYFDRSTGTWRYEEDDGTEMEYDSVKGTWVPVLDEDLVRQQQAAYSVAGVDEETPAAPVLKRENKKRKDVQDHTGLGPSTKRGRNEDKKTKNTAVYITGLPSDATHDELVERFSKCGVIEEDDQGEPKVKMYARDDGSFSGEALVVFFKEESVLLATNLLDEAELRLGDSSSVMRVQQADFTHKSHSHSGEGGGQPRRVIDKKKATKRIGKMQNVLTRKIQEWDDEDGFGPAKTEEDDRRDINKNSRVVVLKHMFTLEDLERDASLLLDLKEDVREECSTLGEVTNVVLYDNEKDGIMTVKFRDPISAQACVLKMNGRFFDGRRIEASLYVGRQRFKRSNAVDELDEGEEAEKKRLDEFAKWLMTEEDER